MISIFTTVLLFVGVLSAHAETYTSTGKKVIDTDTIHLNGQGKFIHQMITIKSGREKNFMSKNETIEYMK